MSKLLSVVVVSTYVVGQVVVELRLEWGVGVPMLLVITSTDGVG